MAGGNVDLTLTGALGKGLRIKKNSNHEFEIFSLDEKFAHISLKYGIEEFNITPGEWQTIQDEILNIILNNALREVYG